MGIDHKPDKSIASICGLFCGSCGVYYATQEKNEKKLQDIAQTLDLNVKDTYCNGCRSDKKAATCQNCFILECSKQKKVEFCGDCDFYPCKELKEFQAKMPHRKNMWKSQERIKEIGWEGWYNEMAIYYSCLKCGTINGAYDSSCRKCGNTPSNQFLRDHNF